MSGKKYTYKVIKEDPQDPMFNVIEKSGGTVEFTPHEVQANIDENKKIVKGLKGKLQIEEAKIVNIEHFHPFVKDFTDEQLSILHTYEESRAVARSFPAKIKEFEESIAESEEAQREMMEQIGVPVPKSAVETPAQ